MYGTITKHLTDLKFSITRVAIGVLRWYAGKSAASNLRLICSIRFVRFRLAVTANAVRRPHKICYKIQHCAWLQFWVTRRLFLTQILTQNGKNQWGQRSTNGKAPPEMSYQRVLKGRFSTEKPLFLRYNYSRDLLQGKELAVLEFQV